MDDRFEKLFNSYYNGVGEPFPRDRRGLVTRPTVADVWRYREHVDQAMSLAIASNEVDEAVLRIGLNHEQQHTELMLTDLKHALSCNPLDPVYQDRKLALAPEPSGSSWVSFASGVVEIGYQGNDFAFDNELPRHRVYLSDYQMATSLVTNGQWMQFIEEGGYKDPSFWLSMGWSFINDHAIDSPFYWRRVGDRWHHFTLAGLVPVDPHGIVTHVSYFEADAFARYSDARLPTEAEWEHAAEGLSVEGMFLDRLWGRGDAIHPTSSATMESMEHSGSKLFDCFGTVWQWTCSPYTAYPGYQPPPGTLGEYNGKFMCNQYVLRGGSCASPVGHLRATYRNFFPPDARWQFSGVRLARDFVPGS